MTKTKLLWRLGSLPTPEEVRQLCEAEIITKDEAREILLKHEDEEERDMKGLKEEVIFLRKLVEKLSNNQKPVIVETIREIPTYKSYPWFQHYKYWCMNATSTGSSLSGTVTNAAGDFSSIKTF